MPTLNRPLLQSVFLKTMVASFAIAVTSTVAFACPSTDPKGYTLLEKSDKGTLFTDKDKTHVLGVKCLKMSAEEGKRTVEFFPKAAKISEGLHKVELAKSGDASTVLYLRVTETELIQLTLAAKTNDAKQLDALEKTALTYINSSK